MDQKPEVEIEARDIVACLRPGRLRRKRARSPLRRLVRRTYALSNNPPQRCGFWGAGMGEARETSAVVTVSAPGASELAADGRRVWRVACSGGRANGLGEAL